MPRCASPAATRVAGARGAVDTVDDRSAEACARRANRSIRSWSKPLRRAVGTGEPAARARDARRRRASSSALGGGGRQARSWQRQRSRRRQRSQSRRRIAAIGMRLRAATARTWRIIARRGVRRTAVGAARMRGIIAPRSLRADQRRVAPHCRVVNLVRSGRKQPQRLTASAGGTARHLFVRRQ